MFKYYIITAISGIMLGFIFAGFGFYVYSQNGLGHAASIISEIETNNIELQQRITEYETTIVGYARIIKQQREIIEREQQLRIDLEGSLKRLAELTQTADIVNREIEIIFARYEKE